MSFSRSTAGFSAIGYHNNSWASCYISSIQIYVKVSSPERWLPYMAIMLVSPFWPPAARRRCYSSRSIEAVGSEWQHNAQWVFYYKKHEQTTWYRWDIAVRCICIQNSLFVTSFVQEGLL